MNYFEMNENGQIAVLFDEKTNTLNYYYLFDDSRILRVNDRLEASANADWDIDILSEDLRTMDIEYLSNDVIDYTLDECMGMQDYYEDLWPEVVRKINEYKEAKQ